MTNIATSMVSQEMMLNMKELVLFVHEHASEEDAKPVWEDMLRQSRLVVNLQSCFLC